MQPPVPDFLPARPLTTTEVDWVERHPQLTRAVAFLGYEQTPGEQVVGILVQAGADAHLVGYSAQEQAWAVRKTLQPERASSAAYERATESVYEWVRSHNPGRSFAVLRSVTSA